MDKVPPLNEGQMDIVAKACRFFLETAETRDARRLDEVVSVLGATMYFQSFIYPFDWSAECKGNEDYYRDPEKLDDMSLAELRKVFTVHMRMDRFATGHLDWLCKQGYLQRAVRRLLQLCGG